MNPAWETRDRELKTSASSRPDQVTAVKHALLRAQYVELEERLGFPVELLQHMAESRNFDLKLVEDDVRDAMRKIDDEFHRQHEANMLRGFTVTGGGPGGGKTESLFRYRVQGEICAPRRILVTLCVS